MTKRGRRVCNALSNKTDRGLTQARLISCHSIQSSHHCGWGKPGGGPPRANAGGPPGKPGGGAIPGGGPKPGGGAPKPGGGPPRAKGGGANPGGGTKPGGIGGMPGGAPGGRGCMDGGAGPPRPRTGAPPRTGGAIIGGAIMPGGGMDNPRPAARPTPGPEARAATRLRACSAGGGPSTLSETITSPRSSTRPIARFTMRSSLPALGLAFNRRNSSASPKTTFMCLSYAMN